MKSLRFALLFLLALPARAEDADADGDGFPDATDLCPDRAETLGRLRVEDGCPDAATVPTGSGNKRGVNDPSLLLGVIYFNADSSTVEGADLTVLSQAARRVLSSSTGGNVALVGHADAAEHAEPVSLSRERCQAVRDALVDAGVPSARLGFCFAMGSRVQAAPGSGQELNRRVEITVKQSVYGAYSSGLEEDE